MSPAESPVSFLPLGAIIQSFVIGGYNIVLGFPHQHQYQLTHHPYFGETIGRIPNRISNGRIDDLNGMSYEFVKNERGTTTLHGGVIGWGKKIWDGPVKIQRNSKEATLFTLRSHDGDEGFPGELEARVWYTVTHKKDCAPGGFDTIEEVVLDIEYEIEMVGAEADVSETVCSMTNHGYWNLTGGATTEGTEMTLFNITHLEVDDVYQIPTGNTSKYPGIVQGEPILFTRTAPVIDDCFVINEVVNKVSLDTRTKDLHKYITLAHQGTGIQLEGFTTEPSFQLYTGDSIDVTGKGIHRKGPRSGIALEPNRYVDAANRPEWRKMVLLRRGEVWGCRNRFRAWCGERRG